jgi:hypothetical protein
VTPERAAADYGVAIDEGSLSLNFVQTEMLRGARRNAAA